MPKQKTIADKERLLPVLWQLLLNKIEREWNDKHAHLANSFLEIEDTLALAENILEDIRAHLKVADSALLPSPSDLAQYLHQDGWPPGISPNVLAYFLRYLSFQNWEHFQQECQKTEKPDLANFKKTKSQPKEKGLDDWLYFGPIILLLYCPFFCALKLL